MTRAGVVRLRRNLAVALGNAGRARQRRRHRRRRRSCASGVADPVVAEHVAWARERLQGDEERRADRAHGMIGAMSEGPTLAPSLLLSMPQLDDPNFSRSVVLLCQHDTDGAFGLVLNRPVTTTARNRPAGRAGRGDRTGDRSVDRRPGGAGAQLDPDPRRRRSTRTRCRSATACTCPRRPRVLQAVIVDARPVARAAHRRLCRLGPRSARRGGRGLGVADGDIVWISSSKRRGRKCGSGAFAGSAPSPEACSWVAESTDVPKCHSAKCEVRAEAVRPPDQGRTSRSAVLLAVLTLHSLRNHAPRRRSGASRSRSSSKR